METFDSWKFYRRVDETWDAMYADCEKAENSIDLEQFIYFNDEIGKKFNELFIKKSGEGVKVRILCDMVGGFGLYNSSAVKELKDAGVRLIFFNPVSIWRVDNFTSWIYRDHRKLLIIDSKVGYIGGVGINQNMKDWRDTQVRLKGEIISALAYVFERMWDGAENNIFLPFQPKFFSVNNSQIVTSSPYRGQRFIHRQILEVIRNAKKYIYITTPYFIPNRRLLRIIRLAGMRGVDVKIMMPANTDAWIVKIASGSFFNSLFRSGVGIYMYQKSVLHAKTMVIDDEWGMVGSANMDNLSLLNYEANICTAEKDFVLEIKKDFLADLEDSKKLIPFEWHNRPLRTRLLELLTRPFGGIL
jgi:cardiolipin synthase